MNTSFRNTIFARVIIPLSFALVVLGVSLLILDTLMTREFSNSYTRNLVREAAEDIYHICEQSYRETLRAGALTDEKSIRVRKGLTLGLVEDFMARNDLLVVIRQESDLLLQPGSFASHDEFMGLQRQLNPGVETVFVGDFLYHAHLVSFAPWQWEIWVLKDSSFLSPLTNKMKLFYWLSLFVLILIGGIIYAILYRTVKTPLNHIISSLKQGQPPAYTGINEFKYLSDQISENLCLKEAKTIELEDANRSLSRSRERINTILQTAQEGFWLIDNSSITVDVNDALCRILGRGRESIVGRPVMDFLDDENRLIFSAQIRLREQGKRGSYTLDIQHADGKRIPCLISASPIFDEYGVKTGSFAMIADISELMAKEKALQKSHEELEKKVEQRTADLQRAYRRLQEEIGKKEAAEMEQRHMEIKALSQAKLASLGEIATGIAHEINQPLSYIKIIYESTLRDLQEHTFDATETARDFQEALRQVRRISVIIEHLLTFGRAETGDFDLVHLPEVLDKTLILLGERIRKSGVALDVDIEPDVPLVSGNFIQLEQVFINLLLNAMDGVSGVEKPAIRITIKQGNGVVRVIFADNGMGVAEEYLDRIFDPFFTTKETGKGTGLGLSISYGIVRDHSGTIVCSAAGPSGETSFTISLPVAEKSKGQI